MPCIPEAKELLSDCSDCHDDHREHGGNPIFDIASPIEGQSLIYSETFGKFINKMEPIFSIADNNLQITINNVVYNVNLTAA